MYCLRRVTNLIFFYLCFADSFFAFVFLHLPLQPLFHFFHHMNIPVLLLPRSSWRERRTLISFSQTYQQEPGFPSFTSLFLFHFPPQTSTASSCTCWISPFTPMLTPKWKMKGKEDIVVVFLLCCKFLFLSASLSFYTVKENAPIHLFFHISPHPIRIVVWKIAQFIVTGVC